MNTLSIVNTRRDLDALISADPAAARAFLTALKGSACLRVDVADHGSSMTPTDDREEVPPIWEDREDLSSIRGFGFASVAEVDSLLSALPKDA